MIARVAVVEDDPDILALLGALLEANGYESLLLATAVGSVEALAGYTPDLIILDLFFGQTATGWAILAGIRAQPTLKTTPVILCTAAPEAVGDRAAVLQAQHTWFLAKPFMLETMTALIRALLAQHPPLLHD